MRKSGILLPIFSLPNPYGIGTLGKEAYDFIDFLEKSHQTYWQVLPIGPTSYGDSPYQSFSSFAGNPYFIDYDLLRDANLLKNEDYNYLRDESSYIDYSKLYNTRFRTLHIAYNNFKNKDQTAFINFKKNNKYWLHDYSLFMTIKDIHNGSSFLNWEKELIKRDKKAILKIENEYHEQIEFYEFIQYIFDIQWQNLRKYANNKNIQIIGDMPIYTAHDSSDVWAHPEIFQLNEDLVPIKVAGCPPDAFSPLGQLWGNPLYDYHKMKENNYEWWVERARIAHRLFDITRIDHFRGFEAYYTIPYKDTDATRGKWEKGPNTSLFKIIEKEVPGIKIIAENLGFLTPNVDKMLKKLGYPGMKVLEFSYGRNELSGKPFNFEKNNIIYPGTHDNPPIRQWYDELSIDDKNYLKNYLFFKEDYDCGNAVIRDALRSQCDTAIISFIDYLQKNKEARINTPSTLGGNWIIRIVANDLNDELANYIKELTDLYSRY